MIVYVYPTYAHLKDIFWSITILSAHPRKQSLNNKTSTSSIQLPSSLYFYQSHISKWVQPLSVKVCAQPFPGRNPPLSSFTLDPQILQNIISQETKSWSGDVEVIVFTGNTPQTPYLHDLIDRWSDDQKAKLRKAIDEVVNKVLTRYNISWEARREGVQKVLKDAGIEIKAPDSFTAGDDFEKIHDKAYDPKTPIPERIKLYYTGLQVRNNREWYWSGEVYRFVSEVYQILGEQQWKILSLQQLWCKQQLWCNGLWCACLFEEDPWLAVESPGGVLMRA